MFLPLYKFPSLIPPGLDFLPPRVVIEKAMLEDREYISALYRRGILVLLPQAFASNAVSFQMLRSVSRLPLEVPLAV